MGIKALCTGSSGFIGSHLVSWLQSDGVEVLKVKHEALQDPVCLKETIEKFAPNLIFHLAAYGNLINQTDIKQTYKSIVDNLFNLLLASRGIEYTNFINFSTSSVGLGVQTMYSATKAAGEKLCSGFAAVYGKPITSIRPFTVIGTGEPAQHLIPTLIRSCLTGQSLRFVQDPTHDFIGVADLIRAIKLIIQGYYLKGEVIDIGTGISTSNQEILRLVEKVTGKKANITLVNQMRSYDNNKWVANPAVIKSLGWKPQESIEDIIKEMVEVYGK